jgi:S1-C subfamily serine protease
MARLFDDDPCGAILEYGFLLESKDRAGQQAWSQANVRGTLPKSEPWNTVAMTPYPLVESLHLGRDTNTVRRQIDRVFRKLEAEHLIEPWSKDDNRQTQWRELTALGRELLLQDSYLEYLFGLKMVVERWQSCVVKILPSDETAVGIGTGFLISCDRVATARHVVDGLGDFRVVTQDGSQLTCGNVRVASSADIDVAVIELAQPVVGMRKMILSPDVGVLDEVVVMGFPPVPKTAQAHMLANRGEVSAIVDRYDRSTADILISCLLSGGYSGGPVMNKRGHAMAVMTENLYRQVDSDHSDRNAMIGIAAATNIAFVQDLL